MSGLSNGRKDGKNLFYRIRLPPNVQKDSFMDIDQTTEFR